MTAKNKNMLIALVVVAAIVVVIVLVLKKIKNTASNLVDETNDAVADSVIGDFIGLRTTAAKGAFSKLMKMNFLKHTWIDKAEAKYNTLGYTFPERLSTEQATRYARDLKNSRALVSTDFFNDNTKALATIMTLRNWVEAAQVADAYYNTGNHKDMNRGLAWMSNESLVEAADYLSKLPTGVYKNGRQLSKNEITV